MIMKNDTCIKAPVAKPIENNSNSFCKPKNGFELLSLLKNGKKCEVVDRLVLSAAKALDSNNCGFSFSFKKSRWNKGWAGFEPL